MKVIDTLLDVSPIFLLVTLVIIISIVGDTVGKCSSDSRPTLIKKVEMEQPTIVCQESCGVSRAQYMNDNGCYCLTPDRGYVRSDLLTKGKKKEVKEQQEEEDNY